MRFWSVLVLVATVACNSGKAEVEDDTGSGSGDGGGSGGEDGGGDGAGDGGGDGGGSGRHHPDGWSNPDMHAPAAKCQDETCIDCHGSALEGGGSAPGCDTCHGTTWRTDCTWCHGGADNSTGAPPVHLSGEDDGSAASFVPHTVHVETMDVSVPVDCTTCHVKPTDVLSEGHFLVGDTTSCEAEVDFTAGLSAQGAWNGTTCSNLYCHGNGQGHNGSVEHTAGARACDDCHADDGSGSSAWGAMSGEHSKHLREGVRCASCHGDTVDEAMAIIDVSLHVNGTPDIALESGMSYTSGRCYGDCHREEHAGERW